MNIKPTDEQVKELWEWCGAKFGLVSSGGAWTTGKGFTFPDGSQYYFQELLNFKDVRILGLLFKYAVPRLVKSHELRIVTESTGSYIVGLFFRPNSDAPVLESSRMDKDIALALFWATSEVMQND